MNLIELAKKAGCERYDVGKREGYLNQSRYTFDSKSLKDFASLVIKNYTESNDGLAVNP